MKKQIAFLFCVLTLAACFSGCFAAIASPNLQGEGELIPYLLKCGGVFDRGAYIELEKVRILYDGETFSVTNNRDDIVRIICKVVGVKKDGTTTMLQLPVFGGVDKARYAKDLEENGWAVEQVTNMVRPGETLAASIEIFDAGDDFAPPDIDGDGYYDIMFMISPQENEDNITVSTSDPESDVYKLKA